MTVQAIKELLDRHPFQPIKVTVDNGQCYEIRSRAAAFLTRAEIVIVTHMAPDGIPAEFKIVSLLQVTSIEPLSSQAA